MKSINLSEKVENLDNYNSTSREKIYPIKINKIYKETSINNDDDNNDSKIKNISIFRLYFHLNQKLDYFFIFLGTLGSIGSGISLPIQIFISSELISDIGNTSEIILSEENKQMIEKSFNNKIKRLLIYGSISFICTFLFSAFWSIVGQRNIHNFKKKYISLILKQEQGWFDKNNEFELRSKFQIQTEKIENGIGEIFGNILTSIFQCFSGFIIAFISSWKLTLVILCIFPLIIVIMIIFLYSIKKGKILSRKKNEKIGGIIEEILYNIKTIVSFSNFDFEINRHNQMLEEFYNLEIKNIYKLAFYLGLMSLLLYCSILIAIFYGKTLIEKEYNSNKKRKFTAGDVINVSFCTLLGIISINSIIPNIKIIQEACISSVDYFNLIERKINMDLSLSFEKPDISQIKGEIVFKNVEFKYPSSRINILNKINIIFKGGKKTALIGQSGCGKSTIVNLLERLYGINNGEILIDNINIKKYDIQYLRELIGYVPQEPILFNKSIKENIIFGREELLRGKNIDLLIKKVCDDSYASEFIEKLPGKINYIVGIKGNELSGGEKQRIAIARALLLNPKILILDEATSSLDSKSEKEVLKAIEKLNKEKNITIIIIAHNSSAINYADFIYEIKDGIANKINNMGVIEKYKLSNQMNKINIYFNKKESNNNYNKSHPKEIYEINNSDYFLNNKNSVIKFEIKRIFLEISHKKYNMILALICSIIVGGINPAIGVILGNCLNGMNSKFENIREKKGLKYGLLFLLFILIQGLGNIIMNYQFMILGFNLVKSYRKKIFEKYFEINLSFYDLKNNTPGAILTRFSNDSNKLSSLLIFILGYNSICISIFITGFIIGCNYEYRLTLISLCFIPFIILFNFLTKFMKKNMNKKARKINAEAGDFLSECVLNIKTIFCFNFQIKALEYYMEIINYFKNNIFYDSLISGFFKGMEKLCIFSANAIIFFAAKKFILKKQINSENLNIIMNVVISMIIGIGQGFEKFGNLKNIKEAFNSLYSILDYKSPNKIKEHKKFENIKGKIEFKNVSFSYPTRPGDKILDKINFVIEPGEHVAIVGHSGNGKSTIFNLLERFYDIEEGNGEILIDDENIKIYDLYSLRKNIGLVSQEPVLFKRNVLENIRYGNLKSSDEECFQAAKDANIYKFNNGLYNIEEIDKKHYCFSGGEKQRLALARIFLKNPKILMLDEITSFLDKENEKKILESLKKLIKNRTTISITHKLYTIENCDKIIFIKNGKIIEQGTHKELMELKKEYYKLYNNNIL